MIFLLLFIVAVCVMATYFATGFFHSGGNGQSILLTCVAGLLFIVVLILYPHLLSHGAPHPVRTTFLFVGISFAVIVLFGWLGLRSNRPKP